jgi:hypothetical protein
MSSINFKAYDYNQAIGTLGGNIKIGSQNVLSKYNFYILKLQIYSSADNLVNKTGKLSATFLLNLMSPV